MSKFYTYLYDIYEKYITNYLLYHNCDPFLFNYIYTCKRYLLNKEYVELPRVEVSIKEYTLDDNNVMKEYRYTISILFSEFLHYSITEQKQILKMIGHDPELLITYINLLPVTIKPDDDIIFGYDMNNKIGKLYFDIKNFIICFESKDNKLIKIKKYVKSKENPNEITVIDEKTGNIIGTHIKNKSFYTDVYWTNYANNANNANNVNYVTKYFRPSYLFTYHIHILNILFN